MKQTMIDRNHRARWVRNSLLVMLFIPLAAWAHIQAGQAGADGIMIVGLKRNRAGLRRWLPLEITDPLDLISVLKRHRIDTVVCGGISREERELLTSSVPTVIENVACSAEEVVAALEAFLRCGVGAFDAFGVVAEVNRRAAG